MGKWLNAVWDALTAQLGSASAASEGSLSTLLRNLALCAATLTDALPATLRLPPSARNASPERSSAARVVWRAIGDASSAAVAPRTAFHACSESTSAEGSAFRVLKAVRCAQMLRPARSVRREEF